MVAARCCCHLNRAHTAGLRCHDSSSGWNPLHRVRNSSLRRCCIPGCDTARDLALTTRTVVERKMIFGIREDERKYRFCLQAPLGDFDLYLFQDLLTAYLNAEADLLINHCSIPDSQENKSEP